jgi:hypothetical protein
VSSGTAGPVVPYVVAWLVIRNTQGQQLWYGASIFDPRGCGGEWIGWDSGTNMAMVSSCMSSTSRFVGLGAGSATTRSTGSSTDVYYDMVIDRTQLGNGIAAYNNWASRNGKPVFTDTGSLSAYKVTSVVLNPETADYDQNRYTRVVVNAADGYANAASMHLWYQRSDLSGWQWAQTITVPGGGGWGDRTFTLDGVTNFAGRITALSFNPQYPGGTGSFGFDYVRMMSAGGRSMRDWWLTGIPNPVPGSWWCDASTCTRNQLTSPWTDGTHWSGVLGADPSFQLTGFTGVAVDPTPMLGVYLRDMVLSKQY